MRVELHGPEDDILLVSEEDLIQFPDVARAMSFLGQFIGDEFNMQTLRLALRQECPSTFVGRLSDFEVIRGLAQCIARSVVGLVRQDLPPMVSAGDTDGMEVVDSKTTPLEELAEKFTDPLEIIPEAVIPPVLLEIALREAESVGWQCGLYGMALDLLKHDAFPGEDESSVAKELVDQAAKAGIALGDNVAASGVELVPLATKYDIGDKANSMIGDTMTRQTKKYGQDITDRAGGLSDRVGDLLGGKFQKTSSKLAPALAGLIADTGGGIKGVTKSNAMKLMDLIKSAAPAAKGVSEVATVFNAVTGGQGTKLVDGAEAIGDKLYSLLGQPPKKEEETALPAEEEPAPELDFEAELIDKSSLGIYLYDSNGEVVAEETFAVILPSGRRVKGKTGADGRALLEDFTPGICKISFPDLEVGWYEANDTPPEPQIHVVESGDTLGKIAKKYNFVSWRPIYGHELNAEFRKKRPNPNLIQPEDEIFIPTLDENIWQGESGAVYGFCAVVPIIEPALPPSPNRGDLLQPVITVDGAPKAVVNEGDLLTILAVAAQSADKTRIAVEIYRESDDLLVDRKEVDLKDNEGAIEWKVPTRVDGDPVAEGATGFYPLIKNELDGFEIRGMTFRVLPAFDFGDGEGYDAPPAPKTKKEQGTILRAVFHDDSGAQLWKAKAGDTLTLWARVQGLSEGALVEFSVRKADGDTPIVKLNANMDDRWHAEKQWTIPAEISGEIYFAVSRSGVDGEHRSGSLKVS